MLSALRYCKWYQYQTGVEQPASQPALDDATVELSEDRAEPPESQGRGSAAPRDVTVTGQGGRPLSLPCPWVIESAATVAAAAADIVYLSSSTAAAW